MQQALMVKKPTVFYIGRQACCGWRFPALRAIKRSCKVMSMLSGQLCMSLGILHFRVYRCMHNVMTEHQVRRHIHGSRAATPYHGSSVSHRLCSRQAHTSSTNTDHTKQSNHQGTQALISPRCITIERKDKVVARAPPVSNDQQHTPALPPCLPSCKVLQALLDERISGAVNICCSFIQGQHPGVLQEGPAAAKHQH